jgi:hypothetical protein
MVPKLRDRNLLRSVGERSIYIEAGGVTPRGAYGSENVGMSNHNVSEILTRRKSKVSWAMLIIPGLVGPKARPKGVVDGQQVNIPAPVMYSME